ncbi:MAG: alpha/beta fold hydrolase [Alphaproteobacteria bacterium]|nr:alpha/beta fold hydrolase [Alphaproteobacteria bacterium]
MTGPASPAYFNGPNGRLAYERIDGAGPGLVWFGGFASDMTGTKASFLADWARRKARAFLRFDYSGHGSSDGVFEEGSISDWAADALALFDSETNGPQILIGSSMGAWIASLIARARPERVAGAVFIAPAPDFTECLVWETMSENQREGLLRTGRYEEPSAYGGKTVFTLKMIEDGRRNLVLGEGLRIAGPVRILQGMADQDVPWRHALRFAEAIDSPDVEITLTKTGDHRLSTPADLDRLARALEFLPALAL